MAEEIEGRISWFETASKGRPYLVGVSGGADSVALLQLLSRSGFQHLVVCHLNHGLRGKEAAADARFVQRLAARLGCDFEGKKLEVGALAREVKISVETAGRMARQEFFAECGRKWRCGVLLLAHHADDQAETVLWNLLRGSRGASGMAETQKISMAGRGMLVRRPLLGIRRSELRDWLLAEGLKWREDASNAEAVAVRNRLRNEALPLLDEIARRDVVGPLLRAAESASELREIEAWAVAEAEVLDPQGRVHLPKLRSLPVALQGACLFAYLKSAGVAEVDRVLVDRALVLCDPETAAVVNLPGGGYLRRRAGRLLIEGED